MKAQKKHIFNLLELKKQALGTDATNDALYKFFNFGKDTITKEQKRKLISVIQKDSNRIIKFIKTN